MTLIRRRRGFDYLTREQLEDKVHSLEQQRDRALAGRRAICGQLASWLATRADSYRADADHLDRLDVKPRVTPLTAEQRRVIAAELDQAAYDVELNHSTNGATA